MSWTPTDEQVEKVARYGHSFDQQVAMEFGHQTELIPFESLPQWAQDTHREKARAQLVAVGPHIAATERKRVTSALRQKFGVTNRAADWIDRVFWEPEETADQIEKEAGR